MTAFESQLFIETMGIFSGEVGCQLDHMCTAFAGALDGPCHHPVSKSHISAPLIYAHRLDLGPQPALKTNRRQKHQMQSADHLAIEFGNDQLMIGVTRYLLECRVIRSRQWISILLLLAAQLILRKH